MELDGCHGFLMLSIATACVTRIDQVNGFLSNSGNVEVCELKIRPVNVREVESFWPDWGTSAQYENYFSPKQVTAVGKY